MFQIIRSPSAANTAAGANLLANGTSASFRVWAPNGSAVQVLLREDPSQTYQRFVLAPEGTSGYWSADISGVQADYQYRFNTTNDPTKGADNPGGDWERVDPHARRVRNSAIDSPGFVVDTRFNFAPFNPPPLSELVIYQMQIGSFRGKNDSIQTAHNAANFTDIIDKIPYIKSMNFNAVQFLPAGEFPTDTGEGYAPTNFFAPESSQGTPEELRKLVDACHQAGLAVLFDVIYNHFPDSDDNLWQFGGNYSNRGGGIYFADADRTPWGWRPATDRQQVHDFFQSNAQMWLTEFNADGLRFDSVHNIYPEGGAWWLLTDLSKANASKLLIAEHDNPGWALGRYPISAAWDMGSADEFRGALARQSIDSLRSLIEYWGAPHAADYVRYLLGSHDQVFNRSDGGEWSAGDCRYFVERVGGAVTGRDDWTARAQARLGWGLNIAMPGTPMLFMGSEIHHYGYWCPDIDQYGDHRFDWALADDAIGKPMRALVTDANQIRRDHPALRSDSLLFTQMDYANDVLAFKRWNDQGDVILIVVNIGDQQFADATYGVDLAGDGGTWEEIFNSQSPQYGGWADSGNYAAFPQVQGDGRIYIRLPKFSALIFRKV